MKRRFIALLSLCLVLSLVPAMAETARDPLNITYTTINFNRTDGLETPLGQEMLRRVEEKLGRKVNIEFNYIPNSEAGEKIALLVNTNSVTDLMTIPNTTGIAPWPQKVNELGASGMFLNLADYEMPNLQALFDLVPQGMTPYYAADGSLYYLPAFSDFTDSSPANIYYGIGIRKDVLEKHDIPVPTTTDELIEVGMKLKELYPDSTPFVDTNGYNEPWCGFPMTFRTEFAQHFIASEGKYEYDPVGENYRNYLKFMNTLYENELIPADYTAWNGDMARAAVCNDKAFVISTYTWGQFEPQNAAQWGDNDWLLLHGLKVPGVGEGYVIASRYTENNMKVTHWSVEAVSAQTKDPAGVVELLDTINSPEIITMANWGIEGEHYEVDADGRKNYIGRYAGDNGKITDEATGMSPLMEAGLAQGRRPFSTMARVDMKRTADSMTEYDILASDGSVVRMTQADYCAKYVSNENCNEVRQALPALTDDDWEELDMILSNCGTYVTECRAKFINGEMDIDTEWDAYVERVYALSDVNAALDYLNKPLEGLELSQ